nr:hypothetical protein [Myxosarcina sp. GI1]
MARVEIILKLKRVTIYFMAVLAAIASERMKVMMYLSLPSAMKYENCQIDDVVTAKRFWRSLLQSIQCE